MSGWVTGGGTEEIRTDAPFRVQERREWRAGSISEQNDKRLLLASVWVASLCGRELQASVPHGPSSEAMKEEEGGDRRAPHLPAGSPRDEAAASKPKQSAPKPSVCLFIPEPQLATWRENNQLPMWIFAAGLACDPREDVCCRHSESLHRGRGWWLHSNTRRGLTE